VLQASNAEDAASQAISTELGEVMKAEINKLK